MGNFEWPWQYEFPPFFSIQPNLETRKKQLQAWCDLFLAFHKYHRIYTVDLKEAASSELFNNTKLNRKLSGEGILLVLEELRQKGNIEWTDKAKTRCLVMWRTPEEWGNLIYKWASNNGMNNSVCTLYEIAQGEDTRDEEFYGLEDWLLKRSLKCLERQRKAELMSFDGNEGVKFF
ncbi:vacuolar protein-sorting-associated protein 25-like [Lytechinus variegatus]|uniref:vacuolar protein-sorting-associated protein 25-like n=1 Tax=Lytechinus variegatus TaxID=7654 RepID=UPI001BB16925|nr:vacuolar protein-sorting-associated protein 25-like [Lytechinus variegatus]XP_041481193.1 vacuolar protein-sorting-associated protein 25-like [Lytechinus variegatus]